MVKVKKGNMVIFGLSDENMTRLKDGQPIKFNLKDLGMDDIDVMIFNGKNEHEMYKIFKDQINPFTTILKDDNAPKN